MRQFTREANSTVSIQYVHPAVPHQPGGPPVTRFNFEAARMVPTLLNPEAHSPREIALGPGERIGDYTVTGPLSTASGEAALYRCRRDGREYVAKLYRRSGALSADISRALKALDSPYVAPLVDAFELDGHPVEVFPFYRNGSLAGRVFALDELEHIVIPGAIEGLRALHAGHVLHRDLKPSNIMLSDDGRSVALIDFGVAAYRGGAGMVVAQPAGLTPEYSAPETLVGLYLEESDYYSLGITLFELYAGYGPYHGLIPEEIERRMSQPLPYPADMPLRLRELIGALTYADITNRHDKYNPNRRWKYDEVRRYLLGEYVALPGAAGAVDEPFARPFRLAGETLHDMPALTRALARNWDAGRALLLDGTLARFFRLTRPDMEEICLHAERDAARRPGHEDVIYWKALYRLNPHLGAFYWRGAEFSSIAAFGREMLRRLWAGDEQGYALCDGVLRERVIGEHLRLFEPDDAALAASVAAIEDGYADDLVNGRPPERAFYLLSYLTSGHRVLHLAGQEFKSVAELTGYMQALLNRGYEHLVAFCHALIDYDCRLDMQLECWLTALGCGAQLELWREQMRLA